MYCHTNQISNILFIHSYNFCLSFHEYSHFSTLPSNQNTLFSFSSTLLLMLLMKYFIRFIQVLISSILVYFSTCICFYYIILLYLVLISFLHLAFCDLLSFFPEFVIFDLFEHIYNNSLEVFIWDFIQFILSRGCYCGINDFEGNHISLVFMLELVHLGLGHWLDFFKNHFCFSSGSVCIVQYSRVKVLFLSASVQNIQFNLYYPSKSRIMFSQ